jgi:hypothetical protein
MAVTVTVSPDGSVTVVDGAMTFPPLSPEAVQAIAAQAKASANATKTREMTETLTTLAQLITAAGPVAGAGAYAQVTVTVGAATAVVDAASFGLLQQNMPGELDASGNWLVGPLTIQQVPPTPTTQGTP